MSSDSDGDATHSPLTPPVLDWWVFNQLSLIFSKHRCQLHSASAGQIFRIKIRRRHVWEDALHYFRLGFPTTKEPYVTFLGEPAVDAGGPLREFFYLLMCDVSRNNMLFCGNNTSRVPNHNMVELSKKTYENVGSIFAASIIHGGPAPSHAVADYLIYGIDRVKANFEDIPDVFVKNKILKN